jgi:MFS family permease
LAKLPEGNTPVKKPRFSTKQAFTSFAYRNYRLWFTGQAISLVGTWMQMTAQGFLVYQLTGSPAYLGYVGFAGGLPFWLFSLYGGVVTDRMPRRTLLLITQVAMMLLAFTLAILTFMNIVQPWQIIILAFMLGIANAFDAPARQSFVVELVEREDLTNAIALNSTMVNLGIAFGPAVAGITYALLGPAWCFTINGFSFIAIIAALLMMKLTPVPRQARTGSTLDELKVGLRYVASEPTIRILMVTVIVITIFGMGFGTLIPAWSVTILNGDSATNGFLQSARGFGSLLAALMIASLGRIRFKGMLLTIGVTVFPILLFVWSFLRWIPASMLVIAGIGWAVMLALNMANTMVQSHVPDNLRGRVMGVYTLAFQGMMPIGALLVGSLAEWIGEPRTVAIGGIIAFAYAVFLWLRVPRLRAME